MSKQILIIEDNQDISNLVSMHLRDNGFRAQTAYDGQQGLELALSQKYDLIVLDCPGAGLAVSAVTGQGRIVIGACTAEQHYSTKFSEYFVPALVDEDSDTNGNGRISLLEAFTSACRAVDDFYRLGSLLTTENPVLEDNGDGVASRQPWKYEQGRMDGLAASRYFLSDR